MLSLTELYNDLPYECPNCGRKFPKGIKFWSYVILQDGTGGVLKAAICKKCCPRIVPREMVTKYERKLRANWHGDIVSECFSKIPHKKNPERGFVTSFFVDGAWKEVFG